MLKKQVHPGASLSAYPLPVGLNSPLAEAADWIPKVGASYYLIGALLYISAWTIFRLWFCTQLELAGDEAYYWVCSRHLDLSYFDKGPGAAWTIAFGTRLFGDSVFGVRWLSVLLSAGTALLLFVLASRLFSPRVAFWSVVVCELIPMFAVGSILMTIDPISLFFWTAAAVTFWKAKDTPGVGGWLLTGVLVGLGALGKYTNLAELISFGLFCAWRREYRHHFLQAGFYLMLAATFACALPMIVWNAQHDWVTVHHLAHRGALDQGWAFSAKEFFGFLGEEAGVLSPLIFAGILASLFLPLAGGEKSARAYLLVLFLPLFLLYSILSLNHAAQANWPAPAYVGGVVLLLAAWLPQLNKPWVKWIAFGTLVLASFETLLLHNNTSILNLSEGRDPLDRVRGSEEMAAGTVTRQMAQHADFLIADGYQEASLLTFYIADHPATFLKPESEVKDQFSIWPGYRQIFPPGASAIFVSTKDRIPASIRRDFKETTLLAPLTATYRKRPIRTIYYFFCRGLLPAKSRS